ncbi:MAG: hypothetical protein JNM86_09520 [Phycisphaerae bacterium]|nr:hypothetical protein [Phycisphaerae bacterium]
MSFSLVSTLLAGMASSVFGVASEPQGAAPESKDRPHVQFRIISEHKELTPGSTEMLGLVFTMEPHWHIYYKGAPGGGNPPSIDESSLPKGYTLGEIQWPAPKRYVAPGGIYDSVYDGEVTLLVPLTVPTTAKSGDAARIGLKLSWLECADVCVFGKGEDSLSIPVGAPEGKPARSADAPKIEKSRSALPQAWPSERATADLKSGVLTIQFPGAERLEFYPGEECSDLESPDESTLARSNTMTLRFADANKAQVTAHGVVAVWMAKTPEPAFYSIKKTSSDQ